MKTFLMVCLMLLVVSMANGDLPSLKSMFSDDGAKVTLKNARNLETTGNITTTGNIQCSKFIGDGSQLNNIPTGTAGAFTGNFYIVGELESDLSQERVLAVDTNNFALTDSGAQANITIGLGGGKVIPTIAEKTGYDNHLADSTQAHSDYLLNSEDDTTSGSLWATYFVGNGSRLTNIEYADITGVPAFELNANLTTDNNKWLAVTYPDLADGDSVGVGGGGGAPTDGYYVVTTANASLTLDQVLAVDTDRFALTVSGTDDGSATIGLKGGYDIPTSAQMVVLGNTSGANTGDQDLSPYLTTAATLDGEVSGTLFSLVVGNDVLDDQYYDSEADLTGLLDNNYQAIVTEGSLADSVIVSADIKDGTIVDGDMANDALDPDKLVGDAVDDDKIANTIILQHAGTNIGADLEEEVTEGSLADSTIVSADIKDGEVSSGDLADGTGDVPIAFTNMTVTNLTTSDIIITKNRTSMPIFTVNINTPTISFDDIKKKFPRAMTVTAVYAFVTGGTSVEFSIGGVDVDGNDADIADVNGANFTASAGSVLADTSMGGTATLAAGDWIQFDAVAVTGAVTNISVTVFGYET